MSDSSNSSPLHTAVEALVSDIWAYSEELYVDAMNCSTGQEPCKLGTPYSLQSVDVTDANLAMVAGAVGEVSLPVWAEQCNAVFPECEETWRATAGAKLGL